MGTGGTNVYDIYLPADLGSDGLYSRRVWVQKHRLTLPWRLGRYRPSGRWPRPRAHRRHKLPASPPFKAKPPLLSMRHPTAVSLISSYSHPFPLSCVPFVLFLFFSTPRSIFRYCALILCLLVILGCLYVDLAVERGKLKENVWIYCYDAVAWKIGTTALVMLCLVYLFATWNENGFFGFFY